MKFRWRTACLGAAVALLLTGGIGAPAAARVLGKADFQTDAGPVRRVGGLLVDGGGWRAGEGGDDPATASRYSVDLAALGLQTATAGTFDFTIERGEQFAREALFTFVGADGHPTWKGVLRWAEGPYLDGKPQLFLEETFKTYFENKLAPRDPWVQAVPLKLARGQRARITITWSAGEPDALYIDGKKVDTRQSPGHGVRAILSRSVRLDVGARVDPDGASHQQLTSVLRDFRILDVATADPQPEEAAVAVASVDTDANLVASFSGKLVAEDALGVTLHGTAGATGTFDIVHYPDVGSTIDVDWRGWGVYLEEKAFFDAGEVNLREVEGYEVYVSQEPFDIAAPGLEPVARLEVEVQRYAVELPEIDTPHYVGVLAVMRDDTRRVVVAPIVNQPLVETEPGVYRGSYRVGWGDGYARAAVVGRLAGGGAAAALAGTQTFAVDTKLTLAVGVERDVLPADEKSTSEVVVTATDANGDAVADHEIRFLLATTSQYTGVVGGGAFAEQVGGSIQVGEWAKTDMFGQVKITYVAGFAAKTAVIVARDMSSGSTGAGYITTFITSTAELEQYPAGGALAAGGYEISVTSSDQWLTADGASRARITARVTQLGAPVEGHRIGFSVPSGMGTIRAVTTETDANGEARAVYTAGKKIGIALVVATDLDAGISGSVPIELRSDAPAKIAIRVLPERLPADGRSRAEVLVTVTDINDNPNADTAVEYRLTAGDGRLRDETTVTDRNGESSSEYVAGRTPGRVAIEVTVRSLVPTEEELGKARDLALAVVDYDFF